MILDLDLVSLNIASIGLPLFGSWLPHWILPFSPLDLFISHFLDSFLGLNFVCCIGLFFCGLDPDLPHLPVSLQFEVKLLNKCVELHQPCRVSAFGFSPSPSVTPNSTPTAFHY